MRRKIQNTDFRFRASSTLIEAARAHAAQEGQSLSALVRNAVRREIRQPL